MSYENLYTGNVHLQFAAYYINNNNNIDYPSRVHSSMKVQSEYVFKNLMIYSQ